MDFSKINQDDTGYFLSDIFVSYFKNTGSIDTAVDGSVTPVEFTLEDLSGVQQAKVELISLLLQAPDPINLNDFGAVTGGLTNGYTLEMKPGLELVGYNHGDFYTQAHEVAVENFGQGGTSRNTINAIFSFKKAFGKGIIIDVPDFKLIVKDNLTTVERLELLVQGKKIS